MLRDILIYWSIGAIGVLNGVLFARWDMKNNKRDARVDLWADLMLAAGWPFMVIALVGRLTYLLTFKRRVKS